MITHYLLIANKLNIFKSTIVEINRLLHINKKCYHQIQNDCVKGYHKLQYFLS